MRGVAPGGGHLGVAGGLQGDRLRHLLAPCQDLVHVQARLLQLQRQLQGNSVLDVRDTRDWGVRLGDEMRSWVCAGFASPTEAVRHPEGCRRGHRRLTCWQSLLCCGRAVGNEGAHLLRLLSLQKITAGAEVAIQTTLQHRCIAAAIGRRLHLLPPNRTRLARMATSSADSARGVHLQCPT